MQKREYREWVKTVYENMISKPDQKASETDELMKKNLRYEPRENPMDYHIVHDDAFKMEESFTIHLGKLK